MAFAFENHFVHLWKAVHFADEVCRQTEQFPRRYAFLVDQLNRAALSGGNLTPERRLALERIARMAPPKEPQADDRD